MMKGTWHFAVPLFVLAGAILASPARAAMVTDSTTFSHFSVTYDDAVWGGLKFPHEADSSSSTLPVSQFGFGRFFFDPGFAVSSDGSSGPSELTIVGAITIDAKPGWGLYHANFTQSGQWLTTGGGTVTVGGSVIDVVAPNGQFFFTDQRAFANPLAQSPSDVNGYYYIIGERSSFSRFDQLTIQYNIHLEAVASGGSGFAQIASDASNPTFLGGPGPYPDSNIVGTFVSVSFERIAAVPEPSSYALLLSGLGLLWSLRTGPHRNRLRREAREGGG